MNEMTMNFSNYEHRTASSQPVHAAEIVSVIANELLAATAYGFACKVIFQAKGFDSELSGHFDAVHASGQDGIDMSPDHIVWNIQLDAQKSVKSWAKDLNAFYNNQLLIDLINELVIEWFEAGTKATNLEPAIESLEAFLEDARKVKTPQR
jgi:hypothetical protein